MTRKNRLRLLLLIAAVLLSGALIAFSTLKVRYPVQDTVKTEPDITRLSLTHSVERGPDGRLTMPAGAPAAGAGGAAQPCPT
jgi:hypothetical protein